HQPTEVSPCVSSQAPNPSPSRASTQSTKSESSTVSASSLRSSTSSGGQSSEMNVSVNSKVYTSVIGDEVDHLTDVDIDQLPSLHLNYFINLLYEAAVNGITCGEASAKDNFLEQFDRLYEDECHNNTSATNAVISQHNGIHSDAEGDE